MNCFAIARSDKNACRNKKERGCKNNRTPFLIAEFLLLKMIAYAGVNLCNVIEQFAVNICPTSHQTKS